MAVFATQTIDCRLKKPKIVVLPDCFKLKQQMQRTIQFESRHGELALIYQLEHDPTVLEYFDQPKRFNLTYPNKTNTRSLTASHTP